MFKNYLIIAFRNLLKHSIHSLVNIMGLSVGIAISILILILVHDELSYDKYNKEWERIFRVNRIAEIEGNRMDGAVTPIGLHEKLIKIPGIEQSVRLLKGSHKRVSYKDIHLSADEFYYADDSYFRVFSIPLLVGDPADVLKQKYSLVLTESTARKYFGDEDPVGKELSLDNGWVFEVTGICAEVPENSHYHFDYLASLNGILDIYDKEKWIAEMVSTYILADSDQGPESIETYFSEIVNDNIRVHLETYLGENKDNLPDSRQYSFYLQPLSEIHLNHTDEGEFEAGTDKVYIYVFTIIALLILVIACVNFMNLATARSSTRSKEIALRKVVGASRKQISVQFLTESVVFSFLALGLSFVVLELLLRPFNAYTGKDLDIFYFDNPFLIPVFVLGTFLIGIFAGSYPAFYLSSFRVLNILNGRRFEGADSTRLRGFLVLSQFTVSVVLFISSMIINQQVRFFREANLGFNRNNIVVVQRAYALNNKSEDFKKILLKHPRINAASVSESLPGRAVEQAPFTVKDSKDERLVYLRPLLADYDFMNTMQMHLVEGEFYKSSDSECYGSLLINETAAREIGMPDPVGMVISGFDMYGNEMEYTIQGVIKDYHFESLHHEIKPLAVGLMYEKSHPQYLSVRISGEMMDETLAYIQMAWSKFVENEPFDYYFLDSQLDSMYNEEETTAHIFTIFSFLAIFIAALGLFGFASHAAEQRTREIGIRKAMGASIRRITLMLSAQFTKWVILANLIAFPLAYAGMKLWLGKFSYHINMEAWLFFLAALLALVIALITIICQAMRSARENPVNALQYE